MQESLNDANDNARSRADKQDRAMLTKGETPVIMHFLIVVDLDCIENRHAAEAAGNGCAVA